MDQDVEREIGERIAARRAELGWSQPEFMSHLRHSGLAHIYQTTVSRIERGERSLKLSEAPAVASTLECSVADLLGEPVDAELNAALGKCDQLRRRVLAALEE